MRIVRCDHSLHDRRMVVGGVGCLGGCVCLVDREIRGHNRNTTECRTYSLRRFAVGIGNGKQSMV